MQTKCKLYVDSTNYPPSPLRFPISGQVTTITASGAAINWGATAISSAGGQYRLCWCAPSSTGYCSDADDFRTDFGAFVLVGPSTSGNDRTCVSGQTCVISGVRGQHLTTADKYLVLDTCGLNTAVPRFSQLAFSIVEWPTDNATYFVQTNNATISWGGVLQTPAGGQYRLCWCAGSHPTCSLSEEFRVDVGGMTLTGPAPLSQDRTCVSGQTCRLDRVLGVGLMDADSILVLDTCQQQRDDLLPPHPTVVPRFPQAGLEVGVDASGAVVHWGSAEITASGGVYRLCWCSGASPCEGQGIHSMLVDLGAFTLIGMAPLTQDRTCVSGRTCSLDGLTGQSLSTDDRLVLLDTCGNVGVVPRGGPTGLTLAATTSGATYRWTSAEVTAAGGLYRMCWCHGPEFRCSTAEDFRTDVGRLTLIGMAPLYQHRTCVTGQTCLIDGIVGTHLHSADRFLVLDTCGLARAAPDRFVGLAQQVMDASPTSSGASVNWGQTAVSASGGQYRLCWCHGQVGSCDAPSQFLTDGGAFTLIGASPLRQHRTCVSGQTCAFDRLLGYHLTDSDLLQVLDTCGTDAVVARFPESGLAPSGGVSLVSESGATVVWHTAVTAAGGEYRLCWCQGTSHACTSPSQFRTDAGTLTLVGTTDLLRTRTCVSGLSCVLDGLLGHHTQAGDRLTVLDTCGSEVELADGAHDGYAVIPRFSLSGSSTTLTASGAVVNWGTEAVTAAGGEYRLCWCSAGYECSRGADFRTDAGRLVLIGVSPLYQDRTCVSGYTCVLADLTGQDLDASDSLLLLETCGVAAGPDRLPLLGASLSATRSGATYTWGTTELTAPGGTYRLCWCFGPAGDPGCATPEEHRVDFGMLTLVGVAPLDQDRTCVSGQTCSFDKVTGQHLTDGNRVMVLDTCGEGGDLDSGRGSKSRKHRRKAHMTLGGIEDSTVRGQGAHADRQGQSSNMQHGPVPRNQPIIVPHNAVVPHQIVKSVAYVRRAS